MKKWKKRLEISFYICKPKIMIRRCTVPEICCATDGWTDVWKRWHIEVGVPPKNEHLKKRKTSGFNIDRKIYLSYLAPRCLQKNQKPIFWGLPTFWGADPVINFCNSKLQFRARSVMYSFWSKETTWKNKQFSEVILI